MSEDFKMYLATEVLSEQRTISYRHVSRALKVHVNAAKCMLYDFHKVQNGKQSGSVHATYLLSGVKKQQRTASSTLRTTNGHKALDEDEPIPSSPPPFTSSMLEPSQQSNQAEEGDQAQIPVRTITLVREDSLEAVKEQYETISSIHIYSLSPTRLQDLATLGNIGTNLFADTITKQDPLLENKTYGIIQNPDVRRRNGKKPFASQGPAPKFQPIKEESKPARAKGLFAAETRPPLTASTSASGVKNEEASRPSSQDSTSTTSSSKKPSLKRDASDLFKAFAKQGHQKQKPTTTGTRNQDTPMKDAPVVEDEEGESEDEAVFLDTGTRKGATTKKRPSDARREREDKAAKLRKMMESDDEDEDKDKPASAAVEKPSNMGANDEPRAAQKQTPAEEDNDQVAWSDSDTEKQGKPAPTPATSGEQISSSGPKRRRGKRKVMKKRTTKDEDGYLVTKEEAVWESYSEEEPDEPAAAQAKKQLPRSSLGASKMQSQSASQGGKGAGLSGGAASGGKPAPKKGGNIMSFFGKKY